MPLVRIEILQGRSQEERRALLDGVHAALVEAFEIPEDDRIQRLVEHPREAFEIPPGRSDAFTLIQITAFPRPKERKRALYAAIVRNLAAAGTPPEDIHTHIHEVPLENWGIRGGVPADEVAPETLPPLD